MSDLPFYNFQTVLEAVPSQIEALIHALFGESAKKQAGCYRCGSIEGEKGSSFSISTKHHNAGAYLDHSDPSIKGNAIGLVAHKRNLSYDEAGRWLAEFLRVSPEQRLHMPKKRPEPKIEKTQKDLTFTSGKSVQVVKPLNKRSVDFAASRGITVETLRKTRCLSTDTHIVFPHFDDEDKPVHMKCWSCDDRKHIFSNDDPVPTLFGKHLIDPLKCGSTLIITEGQWDALTWIQLGFPAVSIPSGVSNEDWIGEDWNFLNRFSQIYLHFDNDAPGLKAEASVRSRLGYDRCKCIRTRHKDANDALMAGDAQSLIDAFTATVEAPIERIVSPDAIKEKVRQRMNKTHLQRGTPFFLPSLPFEFRVHEVTLWYGKTSQGKSTLLSNQIAFCASRDEMCFVASFEQATPMTLAAMLAQYTGDPDIGQSSNFDAAYDELASRVLFYDSMARTNPDELIQTMIQAHKQLGIVHFVVDNVMTLEVDRQDNTAQAAVADKFRVFVAQYPVHLHVVAHPRKSQEGDNKASSIQDIRGAAEWGDMPANIICVWRDTAKQEAISQKYDENIPFEEIRVYDLSMPDGKVFVRKQRETGDLPMTSYWFDRKTKRAYKVQEDLCPYWMEQI